MGEVFQTVPLKTKAWLTKRFLFTPFFLKIWNVKPVCLFQFPTVWVFHFGLVFLQVVAFHHFNVPRHAALSLCLSHPSPLAVCATVRECCLCAMLPEKVAPVSCCRLLSLWVWYYPCWYPHTQPHSCPPLYPSPLFKHSVLIHMLRGIPILLPWFYSFRGCGSPHLWGTTHTHRHLWVEFACMPPI